MEFFRIRKDIPFMRHALVFNIISLITFILAVIFLSTKGLHLGVEFTGGTVMEIKYGHTLGGDKIPDNPNRVSLAGATGESFGRWQRAFDRLAAKEEGTRRPLIGTWTKG